MVENEDAALIDKSYAPTRRQHPRGLLGQMRLILLQPGAFFRSLAYTNSQSWLLVAILILGAIGASSIRQQELAGTSGSISTPTVDTAASGAPADASATWRPALIAASKIVLNWVFLSALLLIVPLSRGVKPDFGATLRMVIWTYLPLGLMAAIQLIYYATGGQPGLPGLAGVVRDHSETFASTKISIDIWRSAFEHLTVYTVWTICLVYLGSRHTLKGSPLLIIGLIVLWLAWIVILPVAVNSANSQSVTPLPTTIPLSEEPTTQSLTPIATSQSSRFSQ